MAAFILAIGWCIFNIAFVVPCAILLFYTVNAVFPLLAAVENLDAPVYKALDLGRVINEDADGSSLQRSEDESKPHAVSSSMRSMSRLLYSSHRKCFSLLRGFGWLLLWNMAKGLVLLATWKLPSLLGFLLQVLIPIAFIPLHILWVHTTITFPSPNSLRRRLIPAEKTFRAVALPAFILLLAEAATRRILGHVYGSMGMKWEDFFPVGSDNRKAFPFALLLVVLTCAVITPAHVLLVRVEASLLPSEEQPIVPLDPALSAAQNERGHMTLFEAGRSLTRTSLVNLIFLYVRVYSVTAMTIFLVGFVDFIWYMIIALTNWRF